MTHWDGQGPEEGLHEIVIVSRDEEFVRRVRVSALKSHGARPAVTVFDEPLSALVHLLTHAPHVVILDMDSDSLTRNLETLRGIRLIRQDVPIILGAVEHCTPPFGQDDDVGVFYRLVKSAPDSELEAVLESAKRCCRR